MRSLLRALPLLSFGFAVIVGSTVNAMTTEVKAMRAMMTRNGRIVFSLNFSILVLFILKYLIYRPRVLRSE